MTTYWWCTSCDERGTYPEPTPKTDEALPDRKHCDKSGHSTRTSNKESG